MLPRFVRGPVSVCLWLVLGCLAAGAGAVWLARVPVYAPGQVVVVNGGPAALNAQGNEFEVATFLPANSLRRLRAGTSLLLRVGSQNEYAPLIIVQVKEIFAGPEGLRERFNLAPAAVGAIALPCAVTTARVKSIPGWRPAAPAPGTLTPAEVEVGSRPMVSLLPVIGPLFGGVVHGDS